MSIIDRLHQLAAEAMHKAEIAETQAEQAYWRGCLFGLETAIAEIQVRDGTEPLATRSMDDFSKN